MARRRNPDLRSQRAKRDEELLDHVYRIWNDNYGVYGARKVWHAMKREEIKVARCTVERLMRQEGLAGVRRGKQIRTTYPDPHRPCPRDLVRRSFRANRPNQLWVADFTYVSTSQGWVYVAFVIDTFANMIVGWQTSTAMNTDLVLDALEQAIHERQPAPDDALIHHSDRGAQYLSIAYSERLRATGIDASVGDAGTAYDNALAETINGLYKTELIRPGAPWRTQEDVERATLNWVSWFNQERLLEAVGYVPPAEAEQRYYENLRDDSETAVSL